MRLLNSGKSRDKAVLRIMKETVFMCARFNIHILAVHQPGVTSRKADLLSRAPSDPRINTCLVKVILESFPLRRNQPNLLSTHLFQIPRPSYWSTVARQS